MKVYIITNEPFPNGMAATNRIKCYAKALLSRKIECEILILRRTENCNKKIYNTEKVGCIDGIPFQYMGSSPVRSNNTFIRKINDVIDKYKLKSYLKHNLNPGDIVFGYVGRDVKYIISIILLTHEKQAFFVRDLCELPYGTGVETMNTIKNRKIVLEKQFPLCDGIISISETLQNLAKLYVSDNCQLIKIPILVDFQRQEIKDCSDKSDTPYIFHSGTLYEQKDGILGIIEAFGKAVNKLSSPLHLISTGNIEKSPHAKEIMKLIEQYSLHGKIKFTGYLSNDELKKKLSLASIVIINKYQNQQNFYCFSTKLGEYLAAEKPVIITNVGEAMNWLVHKTSAYIVEPSNIDKLSQAIIYMMNNSDERLAIAKKGKDLCKQSFDYLEYGEMLESLFNRLKR